jgi:hypothetical protein
MVSALEAIGRALDTLFLVIQEEPFCTIQANDFIISIEYDTVFGVCYFTFSRGSHSIFIFTFGTDSVSVAISTISSASKPGQAKSEFGIIKCSSLELVLVAIALEMIRSRTREAPWRAVYTE